jgi:hypothetical protein
LTETRNNDEIPKFVEEWDPTPLGNVVLLGKRLSTTVLVWDDSLMKTTLLATFHEQLTLGMTLLKIRCDSKLKHDQR